MSSQNNISAPITDNASTDHDIVEVFASKCKQYKQRYDAFHLQYDWKKITYTWL